MINVARFSSTAAQRAKSEAAGAPAAWGTGGAEDWVQVAMIEQQPLGRLTRETKHLRKQKRKKKSDFSIKSWKFLF